MSHESHAIIIMHAISFSYTGHHQSCYTPHDIH